MKGGSTLPLAVAAVAPDGHLTPAQRRRVLLDICCRRVRPGSGSAPDLLHRRTAMVVWPDLRSVLRDIPWVVVGAVATRAYMPERMTQDLDILVYRADGERVQERLGRQGIASSLRWRFLGSLSVRQRALKYMCCWGISPGWKRRFRIPVLTPPDFRCWTFLTWF